MPFDRPCAGCLLLFQLTTLSRHISRATASIKSLYIKRNDLKLIYRVQGNLLLRGRLHQQYLHGQKGH